MYDRYRNATISTILAASCCLAMLNYPEKVYSAVMGILPYMKYILIPTLIIFIVGTLRNLHGMIKCLHDKQKNKNYYE